MPSPDSQDVLLIGRAAAGDSAAFAELYDRHSRVVFGLLLRILKRRSDAEEMLQEVFFQVWRKAADYRPERASPKGWMLMIARTRALDRVRSSRARREREERTARDGDPATATIAPPRGPERLEARERRQHIGRVLSELPDEQRRAIECSFFEGLTHPEIAERLGVPLGTIKSRILLGMKKLRQALTSES
jgi:RNA polymerase sigma-70 factor (ECF subfamily)